MKELILEILTNNDINGMTVDELVTTTGSNIDEIKDSLCDLECDGYTTTWEMDDRFLITLTPYAAYKLNIKSCHNNRWIKSRDRGPKEKIRNRSASKVLDLVSDIVYEKHIHLIGVTNTQIMFPVKSDTCTVCDGIKFTPKEYCLYCDRLGENEKILQSHQLTYKRQKRQITDLKNSIKTKRKMKNPRCKKFD